MAGQRLCSCSSAGNLGAWHRFVVLWGGDEPVLSRFGDREAWTPLGARRLTVPTSGGHPPGPPLSPNCCAGRRPGVERVREHAPRDDAAA